MKTAFVPLTSGRTFLKIKDEYATLIDSFVILPYCILFLKEYVDMAIDRKVIKDQASLGGFTNEEVGDVVCQTREQATFMKQLLQIVDENLDMDDMNILFIADKMNLSTRQFYRRFKEISNTSPAVFIKNHRIEKAAELLRNSDLSIQEIINAVGIQSRAYFYKEFTARYGETPKSYQRLKSDSDDV
jgi:AraC-like DNA-binding protein